MRYLVTGATGFAGPHMINRILEGGDEVVAMARNLDTCRDIVNIVGEENLNKIEFVYGDLEDLDSITNIFENDMFDGVFHLGAFAHPHLHLKRLCWQLKLMLWAQLGYAMRLLRTCRCVC